LEGKNIIYLLEIVKFKKAVTNKYHNKMLEEVENIKKSVKNSRENKKEFVSIVRIVQTDIPGNKSVLVGLTYIKGISWAISNAICKILKINPNLKISSLKEEDINQISIFLKSPNLPSYLMNRRNDFDTGKSFHLVTTNLDMKKEFDIRRLKKIRSYRGLRHALGQPTRGQRTRSHFRKIKRIAVGVKKKKE